MTEEDKPEGPKCDCVADDALPQLCDTWTYKLLLLAASILFNIALPFAYIGWYRGYSAEAYNPSLIFAGAGFILAGVTCSQWLHNRQYRKINRQGVDVWCFADEDSKVHKHLKNPELRPDGWYVSFTHNNRVTYKHVKGYVLRLAVGGKNRQSAVFTESGLPFAQKDIWCRGLKNILLVSDNFRAGVVFSSPEMLLDWLNAGLPHGKGMLERTIKQYSRMHVTILS